MDINIGVMALDPAKDTLQVTAGWWSGVVVSALASINEVNLRRA